MKKSVILLVLAVLLNATICYCYEAEIPYSTGNYQALSDLIVTEIDVPDRMPAGSRIEGFQVTIKNIGKGIAEGNAIMLVTLKSPTMPYCSEKISLGAGIGTNSNAYFESFTRMRNRGGYLLNAGKEDLVFVNLVASRNKEMNNQLMCTQPLRDYVDVIVEVNGIVSKTRNLGTGRAIQESDYSNNILTKRINISFYDAPEIANLKFVSGWNPFSVPLATNTTVSELSRKTGCNIFELPFKKEAYAGRNTFNLMQMVPSDWNDILDPTVPYFADCTNSGGYSYITLKGKDPGPFNTELAPNGLTFLPIRTGMNGNFLTDYLRGCGDFSFLSYLSGKDLKYKPIQTEIRYFRDIIVPGVFYFVNCKSTFGGGVWDPDASTINKEKSIIYQKDMSDEEYNSDIPSRAKFKIFESNVSASQKLIQVMPSTQYRYGARLSRYYYSPFYLVSYMSYKD